MFRSESLEYVGEFCSLGDVVNAGSQAEAISVAGVRSGWKKFSLTMRGLFSSKRQILHTVWK